MNEPMPTTLNGNCRLCLPAGCVRWRSKVSEAWDPMPRRCGLVGFADQRITLTIASFIGDGRCFRLTSTCKALRLVQPPLRMLCASACLLERVSRRGAARGAAGAGAAAPDLDVNAWCVTERWKEVKVLAHASCASERASHKPLDEPGNWGAMK